VLHVISLSTENVVPKKESRVTRIIILVVGILVLILGVSAVVCGVGLVALNLGTDENGFALSNVYEVRSSACAFVLFVSPAEIPSSLSWLGTENIVETKWKVEAVGASSGEIFVGWAEEADGWVYVNGFQFETPPSWNWYLWPYSPEIIVPTSNVYGTGDPDRHPDLESFWLVSESSGDVVELEWDATWDIEEGRKVLIIMNSEGSNDVEADVQLGFKVPMFGWLPYAFIVSGVVVVLFVVFVFRRKKLVRFLSKSES
jgi:hypothetical protein